MSIPPQPTSTVIPQKKPLPKSASDEDHDGMAEGDNHMAKDGDLVLTADGYYGIVTDQQGLFVFLSNGCEQRLDHEQWDSLKVLPLNTADCNIVPANFIEFVNAWTVVRAGRV